MAEEYHFTPEGALIKSELHKSILDGQTAWLRRALLQAADNEFFCDLAWRAGLAWEQPYQFAKGELDLEPAKLRNLWDAYCNINFCARGHDQEGRPVKPLGASYYWGVRMYEMLMRSASLAYVPGEGVVDARTGSRIADASQ